MSSTARPGNQAQYGSRDVEIVRVGRRKQGGAWVGCALVRFADTRRPFRLQTADLRFT